VRLPCIFLRAPEILSPTLVLRRGAGAALARREPQPDRLVVVRGAAVLVVWVLRARPPPVRRAIKPGLVVVVVCLVVRGARGIRLKEWTETLPEQSYRTYIINQCWPVATGLLQDALLVSHFMLLSM
jgi:hypothetical protein